MVLLLAYVEEDGRLKIAGFSLINLIFEKGAKFN